MTKYRIVEKINPSGTKSYTIQQKHFLFRWWWVDAWINSWDGAACIDSFSTFEEAMNNLVYFQGGNKMIKETVVYQQL